jgi:hypothetical protein
MKRKLLEQALEALETVRTQNMSSLIHPAKTAIREYLAHDTANEKHGCHGGDGSTTSGCNFGEACAAARTEKWNIPLYTKEKL